MLADGAERAERPGAVRPDQCRTATRTSRSRRRSAGRSAARSRAAAASAGQGRCSRGAAALSASSGALRLAHQDLEHRADRVELGGAVPPGRVEERRSPRTAAAARGPPAPRREPSTEYAGALMWNSGSDVISRSSAAELHPPREALAGHRVGPVGLRHELRPPGRPRRRDQHRRVVRAAAAAARGAGRLAVERRDVDRRRRQPRAPALGHRRRSTISRGRTWRTRPASSLSPARGFTATMIAACVRRPEPREQVLRRVARRGEHEVARPDAALRHRRRPPARSSACASSKVKVRPSVCSQTLEGAAATASSNRSGIVDGTGRRASSPPGRSPRKLPLAGGDGGVRTR